MVNWRSMSSTWFFHWVRGATSTGPKLGTNSWRPKTGLKIHLKIRCVSEERFVSSSLPGVPFFSGDGHGFTQECFCWGVELLMAQKNPAVACYVSCVREGFSKVFWEGCHGISIAPAWRIIPGWSKWWSDHPQVISQQKGQKGSHNPESLGDLLSPWLSTTYGIWDDPPSSCKWSTSPLKP